MSALLYAPFPDRESARRAISVLLAERLIACANILGEVESHFVWNGELDRSSEVAVIFKTHRDRLDEATARLGGIHPYDTPAIVGWHCDSAASATAGWLAGLNEGAAP